MAGSNSASRSAALWRARLAVYLTFFCNGVGFSNLVPRYPELLQHLDIGKAAFGQAVMFGSVGALLAGLAASWLIARFTSARVASFGMVVCGLGLVLAGTADSWIVLALGLAWVGGIDAVVDVAQNAHGLRVERAWGSSIITSFHAAWSLGAVLGAVMGQALAGWGVPLGWHMLAVLALLALVCAGAKQWMLPGPDTQELAEGLLAEGTAPVGPRASTAESPAAKPTDKPGHKPSTSRMRAAAGLSIAVLGLACAAAMFPEDVASNWSALLLSEQGAPAATQGMGLVALQATMILGRLLGDAVVDRLGARRVMAGGGLLVVTGMTLALAMGNIPGTLTGLVLTGAGCAVAVPLTYAAADDVPGLPVGLGLTVVSWLARVIMLLSPPVVGWFADSHGTWVALVYGLLGGAVLALAWPILRPGGRREQRGDLAPAAD